MLVCLEDVGRYITNPGLMLVFFGTVFVTLKTVNPSAMVLLVVSEL